MEETRILIPCRLNSTRLPKKPLVNICGKPSIRWVIEAAEASGFPFTLVTDHASIVEASAISAAGNFVFVNDDCPTGTDRCSLAVARNPYLVAESYIVLAGDELLATRAELRSLAGLPLGEVATVLAPEPKYTFAGVRGGDLVRLSRTPNQSSRLDGEYEGTGIYRFANGVMHEFHTIEPGMYERREGIELLRAWEAGYQIRFVVSPAHPGVTLNTPEDIPKIESILRERESRNPAR